MKEGWKYKKLGEVFRTYAGGTPSKLNKANYENGSIPFLASVSWGSSPIAIVAG